MDYRRADHRPPQPAGPALIPATSTSTSSHSAAISNVNDLHSFLRRGVRTHSAVLCAHVLLRRGLLLGHPVPAGILFTASACSAASAPGHLLRLLLRHLPPTLPLFSLDAALRSLAPRIAFTALVSLFAALFRSHHPLFPDRFSFPPLLSAAASAAAASLQLHLPFVLTLHGQLLRRGLHFSPPPHATNALLHFYAADGRLPSARHLFDEMPFRHIASCNTLTAAFAGTVGGIDAVRQLFDQMNLRNAVSWNVIINEYVKAKQPEQALEMVRWMLVEGVRGQRQPWSGRPRRVIGWGGWGREGGGGSSGRARHGGRPT
ncbi:hypothetical protein HU200_036032 [Digitaria exilis]|uniref:Pentatricopeptide repeat-containing protein n=1 Tax=Digitaria exilis TaxID=1010633 RepID=A0A835BHI9_9POAL|nr:hypothetical protein HU200_036032 [Digitaria exilis]